MNRIRILVLLLIVTGPLPIAEQRLTSIDEFYGAGVPSAGSVWGEFKQITKTAIGTKRRIA